MTTAQERIAIAIGNFAHAMETNSTGSTKLRLETREELHALFAELATERDAATTARDGMERERDACCSDYQKEAARAVAAEQARDELFAAACKVVMAKPPLESADSAHAEHYLQCALLAGVLERIARAQPEQPQQPKEEL